MSGAPVPISLALTADTLTVEWSASRSHIAATALRAACRCAPCQSARLRGELVGDGEATLVDAVPIGHYAVQLRFGDGHERGIYPWSMLQALGDAAAVC